MHRARSAAWLRLVRVLLVWCLPGHVGAAQTDTAPPLPRPQGVVVRVNSEPALQAAVRNIASGTTILLAPGTYRLARTLAFSNVKDVAIRGDSTSRDAVVLAGPGMATEAYGDAPFGVWAGDGVDQLLIANLTIRDFYFHPIIFNAGVSRPRVYNVRLVDAGQQFLKSNPNASGGGNPQGIVEYSVFEFTTTGRDDYPKAIDLHGATDWIIRNNIFRNIKAPGGLLNGPAILAWRGSSGTVVEGNTFIDCQREIVLGAEATVPDSHRGGVVRNNFVVRRSGMVGDAAISIWDSPGTRVLHNTILLSGTYQTAIEFRYQATAGVVVSGNLTDAAIVSRDGATAVVEGNVTTARPELFADPASGDLHLRADADVVGVRHAAVLNAPTDVDGDTRPADGRVDPGADQRIPAR